MRARAHIEELRGGKSAIIVTELPYGVKKGGDSGVIKKIADLVHEKVLTEISDLADHTDRTGMRIQIELKRDAVPQVALNKLFKHTALQATFGYNAVALVDGVPRTLSLLELVTPLPRLPARDRHAPLEARAAPGREARARPPGYLIALDNLDAVIALIRGSDDTESARTGLMDAVRALRDPGAGDPRHAARAAHRPRAQGGRGRVRRPAGADRRAARRSSATRRRSTR